MQPLTDSTRYFPRAMRSGVTKKVRLVSARARGPRMGRHPAVKLMAASRMSTSATTEIPEIFLDFFMRLPLPFLCERVFRGLLQEVDDRLKSLCGPYESLKERLRKFYEKREERQFSTDRRA